MYNVDGRQAIYASRIWLGRNTTTEARFYTSGGQDRTLFSEDTSPNQPLESDVRSGTLFGPDNSLEGEVIIPPALAVALGIPVDNTTGTAYITETDLWNALMASTHPLAERVRQSSTPEILGKLLQWSKI
jgi:hypothetical protein